MHRQAGREAEYQYFDITNWTEKWTMGGHTALMSIWHRPLHAMIEAFTGAGFRITVISEPEPDPAARELFPEAIAAKPRFLCFLFFVLQADWRPTGTVHRGRLPSSLQIMTVGEVLVSVRKFDGRPHRHRPMARLGEDEHGVRLGGAGAAGHALSPRCLVDRAGHHGRPGLDPLRRGPKPVVHVTTGYIDSDTAEQATRRNGDQPPLTDPPEVHRFAQRPVPVTGQPARDASLSEISNDLCGHLG
ncbi:hypothetical protein QFZ76_009659 [Streptomyces sp. V4I2]|nr:hypothetical protein [Streptomyces sp. V4I2]